MEEKDKIREWNRLIKQYIAQHKYLQNVGKIWITKGGVSDKNNLQPTLKDALVQVDKTLYQLKLFFVPYLDTNNLFKEDELKSEIESLAKQNCTLMIENASLRELLDDSHNRGLVNENVQLLMQQKEEEFNDMLKTQNSLIETLKRPLAQSNKEVEMFRALNTNLNMEMRKNLVIPNEDNLFKQKYPEAHKME